MRILPRKIILVRHAESEGNVSSLAYSFTPDPQVPLVSSHNAFLQPVGFQGTPVLAWSGYQSAHRFGITSGTAGQHCLSFTGYVAPECRPTSTTPFRLGCLAS